jgi:flagella basal body P-ring formation protein FlgA
MSLFATIILLLCSLSWADAPEQETTAIQKKLSHAIRDHIAADTGRAVADIEVQWVGYAASVACAETAKVWIETLPGEQYRGQTNIRVTFTNETGMCGKASFPARILLWDEVPVASSNTSSGEVVEIVTRRVSTLDIRGVIVDPADGPWISVGSLRAGDPVTHRRVKRQPVASVGETIQIVAEFGALTVTAEGRMLADAFLGDHVRVANLATDAVVQGVLIAPGRVKARGSR